MFTIQVMPDSQPGDYPLKEDYKAGFSQGALDRRTGVNCAGDGIGNSIRDVSEEGHRLSLYLYGYGPGEEYPDNIKRRNEFRRGYVAGYRKRRKRRAHFRPGYLCQVG